MCLPDLRQTRDSVSLDEQFFSVHIVREDGPGYFSSPDSSLQAEEREGELRLLAAPGYSPSYQRGLYTTSVLATEQTNLLTVRLLDRPLLPSHAKMGNKQDCLMLRSRDRRSLYRQDEDRPYSAPASSSASGPEKRRLVKQRGIEETSATPTPPRQISADSGIDPDLEGSIYDIPSRITSYEESESFVVDQPHCHQFVAHLQRTVEPTLNQLRALAASETCSEADILGLAGKMKVLCQDNLISFPKSASCVARSPRYQEMLRVSVENVVMKYLHEELWPLIQRLHRDEDKRLHRHLTLLWRRRFSVSEVGVPEDWELPMPASLVELAAIDMRSTPLDRLTAVQESLDQVHSHLREAVLETEAHSGGGGRVVVLQSPDRQDEAGLLAGVLVMARPLYLASTLHYIRHFTFSPQPDMMRSLESLERSVSLLERVEVRSSRASSSKSSRMKRELSLDELISLTDEMEQRYDRHGAVRDTEARLTTRDIFREKLARRLELSSEEMTRHQEEAWARLDTASPPASTRRTRSFLQNIQSKLICSTKLNKVK